MSQRYIQVVTCGSGCKREITDVGLPGRVDEVAMLAGWTFLSVARRWRCGACAAELAGCSSMPGTDLVSGDPLAPADRGALPMPGGFGIVPVMVKG